MAEKEYTSEELREKLAEAQAKLAEAEAKQAEAEAKLKEHETKGSTGISAETRAIISNEKKRAAEKRVLEIPEDFEPDSPNTWQCQINGKDYLVPKGKPVEVPLVVYELYMSQLSAQRQARANLKKTVDKANGVANTVS